MEKDPFKAELITDNTHIIMCLELKDRNKRAHKGLQG